MKPHFPTFVFAVLLLEFPCPAAAQDKPPGSNSLTEERIAQFQKLLSQPLLDDKDLSEEMPLAKFLAALESRFPKEDKISLRIDEKAFGEDFPKVAGAAVRLGRVKNVSLRTVLRLALGKAADPDVEVEYAFRPEGIVITRPALSAHPVVYPVRDVVEQIPRLLPGLTKSDSVSFADLRPTDGPALLVRWLVNSVDLRPWETVQVRNGTRLAVLASPTRQEEVESGIWALRRLADTAVVMNARLYEVDRAFYVKHVAPLFARAKDPDGRPAVVSLDAVLLKTVTGQKLLLESEDVKIKPDQTAVFLSDFRVFRFFGEPRLPNEHRAPTHTGMAGLSFTVRPLVSADRRFLRLRITQEAAHLVGIDKLRKLDAATGKEVEVESPNLRKTAVTGTIQIPDSLPILMPAEYRPPGKGNEDKVWLLVARPIIWIEEEVKEIRKQGGDVSPRAIWNSEVSEERRP